MDGGGMIKNPEILGASPEGIDTPDFSSRFWFAAVSGLAFVGCVFGFMLFGTAVAQGMGLFLI
jgi:hypothetical protein